MGEITTQHVNNRGTYPASTPEVSPWMNTDGLPRTTSVEQNRSPYEGTLNTIHTPNLPGATESTANSRQPGVFQAMYATIATTLFPRQPHNRRLPKWCQCRITLTCKSHMSVDYREEIATRREF